MTDEIDTMVEEATGIINEHVAHKVADTRGMNRAQRRAAAKRAGKKGRAQIDAVTETATKLSYVDLIQRLRELNKKNEEEKEENENATENN